MNDLSNNSALCKIKRFFCELGDVQLKSDYHIKLSLYRNGECEHPSYSHSINGSSKCRTIKVIAVLAAALLLLSILRSVLSCFKSKK